jgi:hypothetical protein
MYFKGDIPMFSPSLKHQAFDGGAVWADAGTNLIYIVKPLQSSGIFKKMNKFFNYKIYIFKYRFV